MPIMTEDKFKRIASEMVTVVNESTFEIYETFDGVPYHWGPRTKRAVSRDRAYLWFGNADTRDHINDPDPTERTTVKDWNEEVRRVKHRMCCGNDLEQDPRTKRSLPHQPNCQWFLKEQGLLYVKEFGRGNAFYHVPFEKPKQVIHAEPLEGVDLEDELLPTVDSNELAEIADLMEKDFGTPHRKGQK